MRAMSGHSLIEKAACILKIFDALDTDVAAFQRASGLVCRKGCGHCCETPLIEATELEMLPLAVAWVEKGLSEEFYAEAEVQDFKGRCIFFKPALKPGDSGHCRAYAYRPLICRLLSTSGNKDKHGKMRLVACACIKQSQAAHFEEAEAALGAGRLTAPVMADHMMRVMAVDPELARESFPINTAFKKALERFYMYKSFAERGSPGA